MDPRFAPVSRRRWMEREREFVRGARGVFLTGESSVPFLVNDYGVPLAQISVVGAAPNTELTPGKSRSECQRLLFVGIDWARKGGPDLLAAFAAARGRYPQLTLEIVGCEPTGPLPDGVWVRGRLSHAEMGPVFGQADALVLPSYLEATPFVIFEALMQGIPVIATTVANMPSMVADAGLCVAPGRPDQLASAIGKMVDGYGEFRARAVQRSRDLLQTHNWDAIARSMLETMIGGSPQPAVNGGGAPTSATSAP